MLIYRKSFNFSYCVLNCLFLSIFLGSSFVDGECFWYFQVIVFNDLLLCSIFLFPNLMSSQPHLTFDNFCVLNCLKIVCQVVQISGCALNPQWSLFRELNVAEKSILSAKDSINIFILKKSGLDLHIGP